MLHSSNIFTAFRFNKPALKLRNSPWSYVASLANNQQLCKDWNNKSTARVPLHYQGGWETLKFFSFLSSFKCKENNMLTSISIANNLINIQEKKKSEVGKENNLIPAVKMHGMFMVLSCGKWNLLERSEEIHLMKCNYVKVSSSTPVFRSCFVSFSKGLIKYFSFLRRDWASRRLPQAWVNFLC